MRLSGWRVLREGHIGNKGGQPHWQDTTSRAEYDAVIIGGDGHGLSTAYYLAKKRGLTDIAVLEGYPGGGTVGRNTTIVHGNNFLDGNTQFYSHFLKLWEGLEEDLNYSLMHLPGAAGGHDAVALGYVPVASPRGVDLIQQCEVTDIDIENEQVRGVCNTRRQTSAK